MWLYFLTDCWRLKQLAFRGFMQWGDPTSRKTGET